MGGNVRQRTFGHMRPANIQIRLRIRAVWSESSLGAFWTAKDAIFLHEDNEVSDQTVRMCRLIWVFWTVTVNPTYVTSKERVAVILVDETWY